MDYNSLDNIVPFDIEEYCIRHSSPENPILNQIYRQTHLTQVSPRMASGTIQGQFLQLLCTLVKPMNVLEIGTYTGYATIAMALAIPDRATITSIEINPELEDFVRSYIKKSNLSHKINFIIGDALHILQNNNKKWDFVFLDANKEHYLAYFKLLLPQMNRGGVIIADNVLWGGKVVAQESSQKVDKDTLALIKFNEYIKNCDEVENMLLPLRDGLMIIKKI
jgi:predicted O-methyltransferase YrrM